MSRREGGGIILAADWEPNPPELTLDQLGLPPDAPWRRIRSDGPVSFVNGDAQVYIEQPLFTGTSTRVTVGILAPQATMAEWEGYHLDLFGLRVPDKTAAGPAPTFLLRNDRTGRIITCVQLWRQRARYQRSRLYAEVLWRPGFDEAEAGIRGGNPPYRGEERQHAERGIMLLRHSPLVGQRGKKEGDGQLWPGGVRDFLDDLWSTIEKWQNATGKQWGFRVASRAFHERMQEHPSRSAMYDWLEKAKIRPQHVESGQVTRSNYVEFVGRTAP